MVLLSQVTIESKPAHSPALYEWPQPFENGDDGQPWHATDFDGTTVEVDRTRKTDNTMWCRALLRLTGVNNFTVATGPTTSPATAWTAPDLTGLGMLWTWAHEGSEHFADFTDTTTEDVLRTGHYAHQVRRYMLSAVTNAGTGNLVVGEGVLCHHVYLTYRADLPNVVKVEVRMSNAAAVVQTNAASLAARGGGIVSGGLTQLASIGFSDCDLVLPSVGTWACIQDRPVNAADHTQVVDAATIPPLAGSVTSNAHCFPRKMWTRRRFVLYKTSAGATLQQAQDLLAWKGLGRATADGPRSYHTVRSWGPMKSLLPRLDLGGLVGGYATAKTQCDTQWTNLNLAVAAGTNTYGSAGGGEFGQGTGSARFGLFQFVGNSDVDDAGGGDIGPFTGAVRHTPSYVRFAALYGSLKLDGCGIALYERTTGAPLTTSDFALAYAGGAAAPNYVAAAAQSGMPFNFYVQLNGAGYEYASSQVQDFAGWTQRDDSWPPHYRDTNTNMWWPDRTSLWGTAPRSNWDFICNYRPLLEQVPISALPDASPHPTFTTPYPHLESTPGTSAGPNCWKDPEDSQHGIRMYRYLIPLAWLAGDLMSIDDLDMIAEWFALEYSEVGYLSNGNSGQTNRSLERRLAINTAAPQTAAYYNGRAEAWAGYACATQHALATVARRNTGYPVYGIRARCKMFYDYIRLGVIEENGLTARFASTDIFGILSPYVGNGYSGVPIPTNYRVMQAGLELPKVFLAYWSLYKQVEDILTDPVKAQTQAHCVTTWREYVARTPLYLNNESGKDFSPASPYNWVASWNNTTGIPEPGDTVWRGPNGQQEHWQDVCALLELAYRASGDLAVMVTMNQLGSVVAVGTPPDTRASGILMANTDYAPGLVALMQRWAVEGADEEFAPPSINPAIVAAGAETNPVTQGDTTVIRAIIEAGANPTSASYTVTAAFSGGPSIVSALTLLDDGVSPDLTAGDLRFNANLDTTHLTPGVYNVGVTVIDDLGREDFFPFTFTVASSSVAPTVFGSLSPFPVESGTALTLFADVTAGSNPVDSVVADCSELGGSAALSLLDDGVAPDVTGADDRYTGSFTVPADWPAGNYSVLVTVTDDTGLIGTTTISAQVTAPVVPGVLQVSLRISPNPIHPGDTLTLSAAASLAPDTEAADVRAFADYGAIGGKGAEEILDDGVAPDATAGDATFTGEHVIGAVADGEYQVGVNVVDVLGGSATHYLPLTVVAVVDPTNPVIFPTLSPNPAVQGETFTLTVLVVPGSAPASSGIAVVANLAAFGLGAAEALTDLGSNVWEIAVPVGLDVIPGDHRFVVTMTDAELREATAQVTETVLPFVPVPTNPLVFLPVFEAVGAVISGGASETMYPVALDAGERLVVYDENDQPFVIESSPDASATNGGQLPITDEDGTTIHLVPFTVLVEPPDPPDPPEPPVTVTIGAQTSGEVVARGGARRELVGAG